MNNITTGNCYTEQYQSVKMGGVSLGISTNGEKGESVLFDKSPQTDFAYTLDGSKVWYDVTDMYGDAFKGCPITVQADNPTCGKTTWSDGIVTKPNEILECTYVVIFLPWE